MTKRIDHDRVRNLLVEAITVLCKTGLNYDSQLSVEGLIGITVDTDNVFLVSIRENFSKVEPSLREENSKDDGSSSENEVQNFSRKHSHEHRPTSPSERSGYHSRKHKRRHTSASSSVVNSSDEPPDKQRLTVVKQEVDDADAYHSQRHNDDINNDFDDDDDDDDIIIIKTENTDYDKVESSNNTGSSNRPFYQQGNPLQPFDGSGSIAGSSLWDHSPRLPQGVHVSIRK